MSEYLKNWYLKHRKEISEKKKFNRVNLFNQRIESFFQNRPVLSNLEKSYLAGFCDGEGYFGITKTKRKNKEWRFSPTVQFGSTTIWHSSQLHKRLKCGILVHRKCPKYPKWKSSSYILIRRPFEILWFISEIFPFLKIKKQQAKIIKNYLGRWLKRKRDSHRKSLFNKSPIDLKDIDRCFNKLKELNLKGNYVNR